VQILRPTGFKMKQHQISENCGTLWGTYDLFKFSVYRSAWLWKLARTKLPPNEQGKCVQSSIAQPRIGWFCWNLVEVNALGVPGGYGIVKIFFWSNLRWRVAPKFVIFKSQQLGRGIIRFRWNLVQSLIMWQPMHYKNLRSKGQRSKVKGQRSR